MTYTNEKIQRLEERIFIEEQNIQFNKLAIIDWSNRVYKSSEKKVTDTHTGGDIYYNMSTDFINEKRRQGKIDSYKELIESSENIIEYYKEILEKEITAEQKKYYENNPEEAFDLEDLFK